MAPEKTLDDMGQPTRPIAIAGRTDIAKVVFADGSSFNFPSIASITSVSSIPTTPSTFRSRSSSQKRGRRGHGGSFSSTSSVRDSINLMSMPAISDDAATDPDSNMTTVGCATTYGVRAPPSVLEHVDVGEDWGTQTIRPDDFIHSDAMFGSSPPNQDHLVAGAEGAYRDLPPRFGDMDKTIDDILVSQRSNDIDDTLTDENNFGNFYGAQSAPAASSGWMTYVARRDHPTFPMMSIKEGSDKPIDLVSVTSSSKATRKPGRAPGSKLPEEKRQKVAVMRRVGACKYCKDGRRGVSTSRPMRSFS